MRVLELVSRAWRILATGVCFAAFGLGGLVLRLAVFPLLKLAVWQPKRRTSGARAVVRITFLGFIGMMRLLGVLRYEVIGRERLARRGLLILANHPTLIDTVFLIALVKDAGCVVKGGLWNNPFTRGPIRAAGYVNNDKGVGLLDDCVAALQGGDNLIIFPEGTRTPSDGTVRMKRGAANVAVRGGRDVTPVVISCDPPTLSKGEKWWRVPPRPVRFRIEVREDIRVAAFTGGEVPEALAARHLTTYLEDYFTEGRREHARTRSQGTDHRRAAA